MEEYFIEEKTSYDKILDVLVFVGVAIVTVFLILEALAGAQKISVDVERLAQIYFYFDIAVFVIFVLDLIRLYKESENFKNFLGHNWLDILATIPFGLIMGLGSPLTQWLKIGRALKLSQATKLTKAAKVSKIGKEFKAAAHLKKESEEYKRKHRL
jgi:hypothetical protein